MNAVRDWFQWLVELGADHAGLLQALAAVAALVTFAVSALKYFGGRLTRPAPPDPALRDPPHAGHSLTRFSTRAVELLGREPAMARLQAFLLSDGGFAWMQIAGVGGQGKSRLGYELTLWARDRGWHAGLLEAADLAAFADRWASWQPRRPHLIVLDYVVGREARLKPVIQVLAARGAGFARPVRLLLLERQRWDRGGIGAPARSAGPDLDPGGGSGRAEWFLRLTERHDGNDPPIEAARFEDGVLELQRLDQTDLIAIARRMVDLAGVETTASDAAIGEQLRRIDSAGRPLYAYFLGQALAAGADPSGGAAGAGWQRGDLLTETLDREMRSRWRQASTEDAPSLGDGSPAERLAVIATIAGGLDCASAARSGLIPRADAGTRRQAIVLTDGPLGSGAGGPSQIIPALQPDLLGEWLVLTALDQGLPVDEVLDVAWRHAPDQTAAFLQRLSQDFPEHAVTSRLLQHEPPGESSARALARVAATILANLHRARRPLPARIVEAVAAAAAAGDGRAMNTLGFCYWHGMGVERDVAEAVGWYRKGVEAGDGRAMSNLGSCYWHGHGVERDVAEAVGWYRKGAEAGDGMAMSNLGFCYLRGEGVERDVAEAVGWYRKGAEVGNGRAMFNLGRCYQQGEGVERDLVEAVGWYRKGAEAGNGGAMNGLGVCYKRGEGVERDPGQAVGWYRKGAEAGDGRAMSNLGWCYQRREGVERDPGQAVGWYRKGAEAGDGRAMSNLGWCYWRGEGVERDLAEAVGWFRKGAEAGDGGAMNGLGVCCQRGEGVEHNLAEAVDWFRKGVEAGDETSASQLRVLAAAAALVSAGSPDDTAEAWAGRLAGRLGLVPWMDVPPVRGDWTDLTGQEAAAVIARLRPHLAAAGLGGELESIDLQRVRATPLPFYPNHTLVDFQLQRPGQPTVQLASALSSPAGAALLDGGASIIHTANAYLLALDDEAAVRAYLRFFCAFVRAEDGPFQIVDEILDLPVDTARFTEWSTEIREAVAPLRARDGSGALDRWRFEACVLHATGLFRLTLEVLSTGVVEVVDERQIADSLPVRVRRYDCAFRTPPAGGGA